MWFQDLDAHGRGSQEDTGLHCDIALVLLHNATSVINIPLPKVGLHWGDVQGKLLEELHVKVGHHGGDR